MDSENGNAAEKATVDERRPAGDDNEETSDQRLSVDMYYEYEDLYSRPYRTPESEIPENLLHLSHSFGYDSGRRANLQVLDERTLAFIAGNLLVLLDVPTKEQRYLRSCSGGGIGTIMAGEMVPLHLSHPGLSFLRGSSLEQWAAYVDAPGDQVMNVHRWSDDDVCMFLRGVLTDVRWRKPHAHPSKKHFAVAEKGVHPYIIIYEYPSLRPYRILRDGTECAYSSVDFNPDGTLLASVGGAPDYMLTLWDWRQELVTLRIKAFSQEVYRVSFSPDNPVQLTTSGSGHIKFWKMASTFTGLKLQGLLGRFGKTALTDIESYVELPDGKVVSGSEWGNMLLWDGGLIKVEICRSGGRTCHAAPIQQFALDEGELMTMGADGAIRTWDFEAIDTADCNDSGVFEMEPMNELVIGRSVRLSSMVKSALPDSSIWFAQDSNGCIWKLNLSFSNITDDPECLFRFPAGGIQGMDVSGVSHLMATSALDGSVKVFDFLAKGEVASIRFKQGGTMLTWAPSLKGGLLVSGFEDGVVRLLELYDPPSLSLATGRTSSEDTRELHLKQALKPHNGPVTAIAYAGNREILATGSSDNTVFFFTVGVVYKPIGFVNVPGPVQGLQWSPQSHGKTTLLILCRSGHVVELEPPEPGAQNPSKTFELSGLSTRCFKFRSIKSRIKREEEIARLQLMKEKKMNDRKERLSKATEEGRELAEEELHEEEEEEEELPPLFIPEPTSPLYCGFYSEPGMFWLSMGGYDSGFLYHCRFSEKQDEDPAHRQDEPFAFLPLQNLDEDPICTITFSSNRHLMLCGMQSGSVRVYPLQPDDHSLNSMEAYWELSLHDNEYGHLRHLRCSHDDRFVLTAGGDGNIFSLTLLPPEELERALHSPEANVPSPRAGVEMEGHAPDIEDVTAYSIETAKRKLETDRLLREAELKKAERSKKLAALRGRFRKLLQENQRLPDHVRLPRTEFELEPRFREEMERVTAQQVMEARKEMAWEQERHRIGLQKLRECFRDSLECDTVTVVAIRSKHSVSTYRLRAMTDHDRQQRGASQPGTLHLQERRRSRAQPGKDGSRGQEEHEDLSGETVPEDTLVGGLKLSGRQAEKLGKAMEKAELARAKIETRKKEWDELYAEKPDEDCEDPADVQAIQQATENMGDFKLKTAQDYTVPEHLRMNAEKKRMELVILEEQIHQKKTEMNRRIMVLSDNKVSLVSQLHSQARQLQLVQQCLVPHLRCIPPALPSLRPEEVPEKRLQYSRATLECYAALRAQSRGHTVEEEEGEEGPSLLELLEGERPGGEGEQEETKKEEEAGERAELVTAPEVEGEALTELEKEIRREQELLWMYEQDQLLEQMDAAMWRFDAELLLLRHQKLSLNCQMKQADLRHIALFQELLLLLEFEERESTLQRTLQERTAEKNDVRSGLSECGDRLELKRSSVAKLQEREKTLMSTFQAMLGGNNPFSDFLTKVYKKKIKRPKKKEKETEAEDSEHDSDEYMERYDDDDDDDTDEDDDDSDDEDDSNSESGEAPTNDGVCPPNCDPALFEKTIQLRERRLDLQELLAEEKQSSDDLKRDYDALSRKVKVVQSGVESAQERLELFNREKQQKLNELDVVVPLRLHQIEFVNDGSLPRDLSPALVLHQGVPLGLQQRIKELHVEKRQQREMYRMARQHHAQLLRDGRDMEVHIQELEEHCKQLMVQRFGKLVDLDAMQTMTADRCIQEEKLKQERGQKVVALAKDRRQWEAKVEEAHQALMEVTRGQKQRLVRLNQLICENKKIDDELNGRQRQNFQVQKWVVEEEELQRLRQLLKAQCQEADALKKGIYMLSRKGGNIVAPSQATTPLLPPLAPLPTQASTSKTKKDKSKRRLHLPRLGQEQPYTSSRLL